MTFNDTYIAGGVKAQGSESQLPQKQMQNIGTSFHIAYYRHPLTTAAWQNARPVRGQNITGSAWHVIMSYLLRLLIHSIPVYIVDIYGILESKYNVVWYPNEGITNEVEEF